jgi:hypothetical protein
MIYSNEFPWSTTTPNSQQLLFFVLGSPVVLTARSISIIQTSTRSATAMTQKKKSEAHQSVEISFRAVLHRYWMPIWFIYSKTEYISCSNEIYYSF